MRVEQRPQVPDGDALRRFRQTRGWTQRDLAARSTIGAQDIARIERNEAPFAKAVAVARLARALGVLMSDLMSPAEREDRTLLGDDPAHRDSAVLLWRIARALGCPMESLMKQSELSIPRHRRRPNGRG